MAHEDAQRAIGLDIHDVIFFVPSGPAEDALEPYPVLLKAFRYGHAG